METQTHASQASEAKEASENAATEAAVAAFAEAEAKTLGIKALRGSQWQDKMTTANFSRAERDHTELLIGGLTMAHDQLIEEALGGLGYKVRALPCPDEEALRFGKEFGNRGQCNPTWFTVGNLVKELCRLRDEEGRSTEDILKNTLFLTAGACGPCRFGMYVTEYRKALRDAGFDGYRVVLFQQSAGFQQATGEEAGLDLSTPFFLALLKSLLAGDVLNALGYRLRPYELEAGSTDRALEAAKAEVGLALREKRSVILSLRKARRHFNSIAIDPLRPRPKVSVIGEFWAMTTEGDGNYHLQSFLQGEGAEVDVQLVTAWLLYLLWEVRHDTETRMGLRDTDEGYYGLGDSDAGMKLASVWVGELACRLSFQLFARAVGLKGYHLPDMQALATIAHEYYDQDLRGGEGHMEVAKLILNVQKKKSHMTLSVKPFGCMPSSGVSDGVQSLITERLPEAIYCPVETSGDGAVNFYSRVQMFLFKARQRALSEFNQAMEEAGVTEAQLRSHLAAHPKDAAALTEAPHHFAGRAADRVRLLAPLVKAKGRLGRVKARLKLRADALNGLRHTELPMFGRFAREGMGHLPSMLRGGAGSLTQLPTKLFSTLQELAKQALSDRELAEQARQARQEPLPEKDEHSAQDPSLVNLRKAASA